MERPLAALALSPQLIEHFLVRVYICQLTCVYFTLFPSAVLAKWCAWNLILCTHQSPAPHTGFFLHGEIHDSSTFRGRLAYSACVITTNQCLWVGDDRLEYAGEGVGQLVG